MTISVQMFETPSGNIRGVAHVNWKDRVLMNATFFTDRKTELASRRLPTRLDVAEALEIAELLNQFALKVRELDESKET